MLLKQTRFVGFILEPHHRLGYVLDIVVPKTVDSIFSFTHMHACMLASIIGQIISMSLSTCPVARLHTRASYNMLNQRRFWSDRLRLSDDACNELMFWKSALMVCQSGDSYEDSLL